ncbi:MAG: PD-(D/E)XK nuclease family transposase [Prevotellaceae bacterium]|nr:PD-(D/E)XK nuclease family transposase [Prevotellaceae bacterium]
MAKFIIDQFSDKVRMIFLQLPLFTKEADECESKVERWIYLLKNMETLTRLPWAAQSSVFDRLAKIADVASLTRSERLKYDEALKKYRDTLSVLEGARIDGLTEGRAQGVAEDRAKGLAEGRAEGIAEEKKATASKMKSMGLPIDSISEITGLSVEDIKDL